MKRRYFIQGLFATTALASGCRSETEKMMPQLPEDDLKYRPLLEAAVQLGTSNNYESFCEEMRNQLLAITGRQMVDPPRPADAMYDQERIGEWLTSEVAPAYVEDGYSKCIWFGYDELNMEDRNLGTAGVAADPASVGIANRPELDTADPRTTDYLSIPMKEWLERCSDWQELELLFFGWPAYIAFQLNHHSHLFKGLPLFIGDYSGSECVALPQVKG